MDPEVKDEEASTSEDETTTESMFDEFVAGDSAKVDSDDTTADEESAGEVTEAVDETEEGEPSGDESHAALDGGDADEGGETAEADPLEGASPELKALFLANKAEIDNLTHRIKSDNGRVSGLQKKINTLEKTAIPAVATPKEFAESFTSADDWKEFQEDNPELSEKMSSFMTGFADNAQANMDKVTKITNALVDSTTQVDLKSDQDALTQAFPEWESWLNSTDFEPWLQKQPAMVQEILAEGSVDDSIWLLGQYETNLKNTGKLKTAPPKKEVASKVAKIKAKRSKQLEAGAQAPSQGGSATPISDTDSTSMFDYYVSKQA